MAPAHRPTGDAPMPHPDNAPGLADLDRLAIGDIAALPPVLLLALQEAAVSETARVKRLRDRLEAAIAQRYGTAAAARRAEQGKTAGTVRIEDEGIVVVADLPKKVSWDQAQLAAMVARIRDANDDPAEYLEIVYRVSERRYGAWPEAIRKGFDTARTETTGKPVFRLETRDR